MQPFDRKNQRVALDLRAALADLRKGRGSAAPFFSKTGFAPDAACADFAYQHAGVPARPRSGSEPAVLYRQTTGPDLLLGLYGCEQRLKNWLPALRGKPVPQGVAELQPIAPDGCALTLVRSDPMAVSHLPFPRITPRDAGRYVTMGFVMSGHEGASLALSAHRMLVLGDDRLGISMLSSRHLRALAHEAWAKGHALPVSINIGVPPAVAIASATATAHLPDGFDKLSLSGGLAQAPVKIAYSPLPCLPQSEFVLLGELTSATCLETTAARPLGVTMPEFLGYDGFAGAALNIIKVTGVYQRPKAMLQATVGPGREQSAILGLGGAVALSLALKPTGDLGAIADLRYAMAGGGMLLLYVALQSGAASKIDLGQLAHRLISIMPFTKTIVFTDDDIDLANDEDVLWAMTTRCNLTECTHRIDGFAPLRMDPSQTELWTACTTKPPAQSWIDATVPTAMRGATQRSFRASAKMNRV